jgi:hypothetical protein
MHKLATAVVLSLAFASAPILAQDKKAEAANETSTKADAKKTDAKKEDLKKEESKKKVKKGGC